MLSPQERLDKLEKVLEELEDLSERMPIIVEGARDAVALRRLGITKNVMPLNKGVSVFAFCERLSRTAAEVVILTDWDRRGGQLARMLKEGMSANGVRTNDRIRTEVVILAKKEVKDIESLPTFLESLRRAVSGRL